MRAVRHPHPGRGAQVPSLVLAGLGSAAALLVVPGQALFGALLGFLVLLLARYGVTLHRARGDSAGARGLLRRRRPRDRVHDHLRPPGGALRRPADAARVGPGGGARRAAARRRLGILAAATLRTTITADPSATPLALAPVAVTAAVHLLAGRRTLLSVAIGTPSYVVLVDLP